MTGSDCQTCSQLVNRDNQNSFDIPIDYQVKGMFSQLIGEMVVDYKTCDSCSWKLNKNFSFETIKTLMSRGYFFRESATGKEFVLGDNGLFHFLIKLDQTPIPIDYQNDNNDVNQPNPIDWIWNGIEWIWGGATSDDPLKAAADGLQQWQIDFLNNAEFLRLEAEKAAAASLKNIQDASAATLKAAQDAADFARKTAADAAAATLKAAQDAFDATLEAARIEAEKIAKAAAEVAAKAAADAAAAGADFVDDATKNLQKNLLIGGGVALIAIVGIIVVTRK